MRTASLLLGSQRHAAGTPGGDDPEAAKHGSYVWLLDALSTDPAQVVPLAKANPQTAFGLLADPAALTEDCVAALAACRNLVVMPLLNTPELTPRPAAPPAV